MKKILLIGVMVGLMSWLGCGDDGPTEPPPPTIITVTAATGLVAPERESVDDSIWTRIAPKNVPIAVSAFSSAAKRRPSNALAVASGVAVQALVVSDRLYMRLAWTDATEDNWPGRFEVTSFDILGSDTLAHFTQDILSFKEDQLMVFFDGGTEFGWDVWNWRMTTTGAGYLAEGAVLNGTTLTVDPGDNTLFFTNADTTSGQPVYMHPGGPADQSYRLLTQDAVAYDFNMSWALGDLIPGWIIDGLLYQEAPATRGGRFDIDSYSRYASSEYVVVLSRALNTGYETDLDLSGLSTINVRVGITDNADFMFNAGSTHQGFSNTFKLNLP